MKINKTLIAIFYILLFALPYHFILTTLPIAGGDYININSFTITLFANMFGWCSFMNLGSNCIPTSMHYAPIGLLMSSFASVKLPSFLIERIVWWGAFFLISFFSITMLYKKLFPQNPFWILSPLIFIANTYVFMLLGGGQIAGIGLAYALMPMLFYFVFTLSETIEKRDKTQLVRQEILYILLMSIEAAFDLRMYYIFLCSLLVYFLVQVLRTKHIHVFVIHLLAILVIPMVFVVLLHMYWILPVLIIRQNPIVQLGSAYSSVGAAKFLSFATFENAMGLLQPNWPENIFGETHFMRPDFLLLPLFAFTSLFFIGRENVKKQSGVIVFILMSLLGIFLSKGTNDPFGNVYIWMFQNVPGFQAFRDATKWYVLIAVSYSLLIPYVIGKLSDILKEKFK